MIRKPHDASLTQEDCTRQPLYRHIQRQLQDRITRGEWVDGQALPNRRALCAEFNTTRVTVDKAVDGLVRSGWLRSAVGSGTFVSAPPPPVAAPAPKAAGLQQISVMLGSHLPPDVEPFSLDASWGNAEDFFFGPLFQGIRDGLSGQPVNVTYAHVESGDYLEYHRQSNHDGLIVIAPKLSDVPALRRLAAAGVPFVAVAVSSGATPDDRRLACVDSDNQPAAAAAVEHLLGLGHRRIGLVCLAMSHANHHDRMTGYLRALAEAGLSPAPEHLLLAPHYKVDTFEASLEAWLSGVGDTATRPTAILAADYTMALATLQGLRRRGLRVPEDVSLISFDDPVSAAHLAPPLTTVRQPIYQMGRRAARRLLDHLQEVNASPLAGTETLKSALIVRDSTCPPQSKHNSERTVEP